ncbi:MAG: type II secretion system protein [Chloroflexi bacterium]|nr:type II secretion system protein [Chloroflexota bacterium]
MRNREAQRGIALLETLMALALLGVIGVGFMAAASTSGISTARLDERVEALALARAQVEKIKSLPYASSYTVSVTPPSGYSIAIQTQVMDELTCIVESNCDTLQDITVSVTRGVKTVLSLKSYKKK